MTAPAIDADHVAGSSRSDAWLVLLPWWGRRLSWTLLWAGIGVVAATDDVARLDELDLWDPAKASDTYLSPLVVVAMAVLLNLLTRAVCTMSGLRTALGDGWLRDGARRGRLARLDVRLDELRMASAYSTISFTGPVRRAAARTLWGDLARMRTVDHAISVATAGAFIAMCVLVASP